MSRYGFEESIRDGAPLPLNFEPRLIELHIDKEAIDAAYAELSFNVVIDDHCDVYGRTIVRLGELMETYSIIRQILKQMPDGPIATKAPRRIPEGEAVSRYEAPRGEDVHYVRGNGSEKPATMPPAKHSIKWRAYWISPILAARK